MPFVSRIGYGFVEIYDYRYKTIEMIIQKNKKSLGSSVPKDSKTFAHHSNRRMFIILVLFDLLVLILVVGIYSTILVL